MTRATSGLNSQGSFAFFDPATRSWRTSAATLDSGFPMFSGTLPKRGSMRNGWLYERPMWAPPIDANASSSLLATPLPSDVTGGRTTKGSKRTGETGLRLQVKALLPTPSASDHTGGEGATRSSRREDGVTGGPSLRDIGHLLPTPAASDGKGSDMPGRQSPSLREVRTLLPTPVTTDAFGSRRATARTDEWTSNPGTTLTDAIWQAQGRETDTTGQLLPTPKAGSQRASRHAMVEIQQWSAPSLEQALEIAQGILPREFRSWDEVPGWSREAAALLPTPMANTENPGSGGELRAAITHGPARRNETGIDSWGRANHGRSSGASTRPPSTDGSTSSDDRHPGQLTIEDA